MDLEKKFTKIIWQGWLDAIFGKNEFKKSCPEKLARQFDKLFSNAHSRKSIADISKIPKYT